MRLTLSGEEEIRVHGAEICGTSPVSHPVSHLIIEPGNIPCEEP